MEMMLMVTYKPPKISNGDLNVPVTFFVPAEPVGPYPGPPEKEVVFQTLCELYDSSTKDFERVNTTDMEYIATINIRNPYTDYQIKHSDKFEVDHHLYEGVIFNVEHFTVNSDDRNFLKIVGVAHG